MYCRIKSDVRAGVGVRATEDAEARISWNWDGSREEDGSVSLIAKHEGNKVTFKIVISRNGNQLEKEVYSTEKGGPDG